MSWRRRLATTPPAAFPRAAAAAGLLITIAVTLVAAHHARVAASHEQARNRALAAEATRTAVEPVLQGLDALATLYAPTGTIPSRQLTLAARRLLETPAVQVVSILRRVTRAERPAFERRHGPIVELDGRTPAPVRSAYVVISEGRIRAGGRVVRSVAERAGGWRDAAPDPIRGPALRRAVAGGRPTATLPARGIAGAAQPVVAFYRPVRRLDGARSSVIVAVIVNTRRLVRSVSAALPREISATVADGTASLVGGTARSAPRRQAVVVPVAGRRWTVRIDPVAAAWSGTLATAGVGLSLTLLVVLGLGVLARREERAQAAARRGAEERDAATEAAQDARRHSRFLEQNATDILFLTAPDGALTYVSPAAGARLDRAPAELQGRRLADLVHPDEAAHVSEVVRRLGQTDGVVELRHRVRHREGGWLWVETLLRAVRDPATGLLVEGQGSMRDITRRREAERRLREAENRFRSAFDEAPVGMAVIALDGGLLQINRALVALCGWEEADLRDATFDALLHQADADVHQQARDALADGELRQHHAELRLVQPSGDVVWTTTSTTAVLGADGHVRHYLAQTQDISERRRAEASLAHLADHDPLTGLLNRRAFARSLDEHLRRVRRYGGAGAVLVVDLDAFAVVNERVGRARGDELLAAVAQALRRQLRDADLLARHGGDEFAVLLTQADLADAVAVGASLVDAVRGVDAGPELTGLTASIGLALVDRPERRGDDLLSNADLARYDAKQAGRDRVLVAESRPRARPRTAPLLDAESALRAAIREERLLLHADPVVDLETGATSQLDLLLRVRTPDGDLQSPSIFRAAAERAGLTVALDRWVIGQAAALLGAHPHGPALCVPVSVRSLVDDTLADVLARELTRHGADPRRLVVALHEHEAVAHLPRVQELGRDLRDLGCPLAIDDAGGGFGSFYFLKHLPFDVLRIDPGFVRGLREEHVDQVVVRSMVELVQGLGARSVAKGVTDAATLATLFELGVDLAQGPHVGSSVPVGDALAAAAAERGA